MDVVALLHGLGSYLGISALLVQQHIALSRPSRLRLPAACPGPSVALATAQQQTHAQTIWIPTRSQHWSCKQQTYRAWQRADHTTIEGTKLHTPSHWPKRNHEANPTTRTNTEGCAMTPTGCNDTAGGFEGQLGSQQRIAWRRGIGFHQLAYVARMLAIKQMHGMPRHFTSGTSSKCRSAFASVELDGASASATAWYKHYQQTRKKGYRHRAPRTPPWDSLSTDMECQADAQRGRCAGGTRV